MATNSTTRNGHQRKGTQHCPTDDWRITITIITIIIIMIFISIIKKILNRYCEQFGKSFQKGVGGLRYKIS